MSSIGTIAVNFTASTGQFISGLTGMRKESVKFSNGIKKDALAAGKDFAAMGKVVAASAAAIGVAIIAGIANSTQEISKLVDEAKKIGIAVSSLESLAYAAKTNGSDMETLKRGFTELQKSINSAVGGNEKAYDSFTRLGLSVEGLNKLSPDEQFKLVTDALSKVEDATERSTLGFDILGKTYTELTPMMAGGLSGLNAAAMEAAKIGQTLSATDNQNVKDMGENWEWLKNTIVGAFNTVSAAFAPIFNEVFNYIKTWILEGNNFRDAIMLIFDVFATGALVVANVGDGINAFIKLGSAGFSGMAGVVFAFFEGTLKGIDWLAKKWIGNVNMMIDAWNLLPFTKKIEHIQFNLLDGAIAEIKALREGSFAAMSEFGNAAGDAWSNGFGKKAEGVIDQIHAKLASIGSDAVKEVAGTIKAQETNTKNSGAKTPTDAEKNMSVELGLTNFFGDLDKQAKVIHETNQKLRDSVLGDLVTPYDAFQLKLKEVDYALSQNAITTEEAQKATKHYTAQYQKDFTLMGQAVTNFTDGFSQGFAEVLLSGKSFSDGFKQLFKSLLMDMVKQWIAAMMKMLMAKMLIGLGSMLGGSVGGAFTNLGNFMTGAVPAAHASGGPVSAGIPTMVGERGKEMFVPSTDGMIVPNYKLGSMSAAPTITYQIYAYDTDSVEATVNKMRPTLMQDAISGYRNASARRKV